MRVFLKVIGNISEWSGRIFSFLILGLIGAICFEVAARYIFNQPTLWAHETAQFLFGSMAILTGAYVLHHEAHVRMDVFYSRFSTRRRALVDACMSPLLLSFCIILVWKGGALAWTSVEWLERSSSQWGPPLYPVRLTIPIGASLLLLQGVANLVRDLSIVFGRTGRP